MGYMLRSNSTLKHLDLSWNALRGSGAAILIESLAHLRGLESLCLSWNGLAGVYVYIHTKYQYSTAVFGRLSHLCRLESLRLGWNGLAGVYACIHTTLWEG